MDTNLSSILSNPDLLSAVTDQDLKAWIAQYPYVPLFRLEQYKRDRTYDNALQASFRVHNRDILYQLLYNKETDKKEVQQEMQEVPVKEEAVPVKENEDREDLLQAEEEIKSGFSEKEIHLDELQEFAEQGEKEPGYTEEKNPADELPVIPEQDEVKFDRTEKDVHAGRLPVLPEQDEVKLDISEGTSNPEELPVTIPEPEELLPVVQQQVQHEEEKKPDAEHTIADDVLETIRKLWAEREKAKSEPEITKETGTGPKEDLLFQKTEEEKVFIPEVEEDVIEEHHEPEIITDKENIAQEEKVSEEVHEQEISTEQKEEAEPDIKETELSAGKEETEEKETSVESAASETEQNKEEAGKVVNTELPQNTEEEQKEKKSDDKIVQPWLENEQIPQPEITENTGAEEKEETGVEEARDEEMHTANREQQTVDTQQEEEETEVEEKVEAENKETQEEAVEEKTGAEKQASAAEEPEPEIKEEEEKQAAGSKQEEEETEVEEQVEAENKETKEEAVEEKTWTEKQASAAEEPESEIKEEEKSEVAAEIQPPVVENEEVPQNTEEEQEAKKEAKAGITAESESGVYIPPVEVETPSQKSEPTKEETVKPPISTDEPHSIIEWISLLDGGIQVEKPFDSQPKEEWIEIPRYEIEFQQQHKNVYTVEDFEGELDKKEDLDEDLNRMAGESVEFKQDMMTETLAQVYLKQGKPEKALSIYNTLRLKFPEKSAYFAALIEKIEKGE